jgi:hypothetical protein
VLSTGLAVSTAEELLRAPDLDARKRLAAAAADVDPAAVGLGLDVRAEAT